MAFRRLNDDSRGFASTLGGAASKSIQHSGKAEPFRTEGGPAAPIKVEVFTALGD